MVGTVPVLSVFFAVLRVPLALVLHMLSVLGHCKRRCCGPAERGRQLDQQREAADAPEQEQQALYMYGRLPGTAGRHASQPGGLPGLTLASTAALGSASRTHDAEGRRGTRCAHTPLHGYGASRPARRPQCQAREGWLSPPLDQPPDNQMLCLSEPPQVRMDRCRGKMWLSRLF